MLETLGLLCERLPNPIYMASSLRLMLNPRFVEALGEEGEATDIEITFTSQDLPLR